MFIHDVIKIKYIKLGYLPDRPYRMISDKEMFDAFLKDDGFFYDTYTLVDDNYKFMYEQLYNGLKDAIQSFLDGGADSIPTWVYSFMIEGPIGPNSPGEDIAYLNELLNIDADVPTDFTPETTQGCYKVSAEWLEKMKSKYPDRPPSLYGDPHVIKSLRLSLTNSNII